VLWLLATEPGMLLLHKDLSKDIVYLQFNPILINSILYAFEIQIHKKNFTLAPDSCQKMLLYLPTSVKKLLEVAGFF
jgi:hypothetical protein